MNTGNPLLLALCQLLNHTGIRFAHLFLIPVLNLPCEPPHKYSSDTSSLFYKDLKEVYDLGKNLSKEQSEIAMFWDCNPFALQQVGHLEFGIKKISPGGHWMGITGIACKKQKLSLSKTAYVHAIGFHREWQMLSFPAGMINTNITG